MVGFYIFQCILFHYQNITRGWVWFEKYGEQVGKRMSELPLAAVDRIIRKATGVRVSEEAAKALAEQLEEMGMTISREASVFAKHANRKTITGADIKLAIKK
ncbi:MAG: histone family protein [Candidatus Diapherotrites archaeon]|uniref:Histone family protein n=1 Tax=Candidatus Iainarchaeum sp. TaxID=3101447 RepID=A0A8T4CAN7_9ARCH|nr:histone family protein [Candidatus Diapherotrites archaeon]